MKRAVAVCFLLSACSPEYELVVRFATPELAARVDTVEVVLVASCAGLAPGDVPADAVQRLILQRGIAFPTLSPVTPGTYGLAAVGRDGTCTAVAAADCVERELERTGAGELPVELSPFAGVDPMCTCVGGMCASMDAGRGGDAGPGEDGGALDAAGADAGACGMCAACADCVVDRCRPVRSRCEIDEFCDIQNGCTRGIECTDSVDCEDDGDTCTMESCDVALDAPICVIEFADNGTACTSGPGSGVCQSGRCCTSC